MSVQSILALMLKQRCQGLAGSKGLEPFIIATILVNGVIILGLEIVPSLESKCSPYLKLGNQVIITVFIVEAAFKIYVAALHYHRYFGNGWERFATIAPLARLLSGDAANFHYSRNASCGQHTGSLYS